MTASVALLADGGTQEHLDQVRRGGVMFEKVLWATDGSEAADQAMPLARTLAEEGDGQLLVVHCQELMMAAKAAGHYPRFANDYEPESKD